ncbi:MAG: UDP-glucose 4-epimerase GalE [Spirochaetaceae bacterium]|jgi:UDP-glucose 4-epimerase|nr:UDP-glucose 4-epimerase GalE [Spirochaetaceae bacterium]
MNILVIGGAGYIGSHVARELLDRGHLVTVYDNLSSGRRENLFPEADFIYGDILREADMFRAAAGRADRSAGPGNSAREAARKPYDALVHLAAFKAAGESMLKPEKYSVNNISGTITMLNAAAETGIRHIVFSSSAAVYGDPEFLPVDENHPTRPANYYGFTKLEIERFLAWYETLKHIRFAALRYFNAAGYDARGRITALEQNPANLIPVIMETAAGMRETLHIFGDDYDTPDGTCIRDYVHVSDLASAHAAALEYLDKTGESLTVNLGSETGFSVKEMLETARRVTGRPIPAAVVERRAGDPAKLTASARRAREKLGWKAEHSTPEALLGSTWDAYKKAAGQ